MATFLILAPFGAFAMLTLVAPAEISLFAGAATALATILMTAGRRQCSQNPTRSEK